MPPLLQAEYSADVLMVKGTSQIRCRKLLPSACPSAKLPELVHAGVCARQAQAAQV